MRTATALFALALLVVNPSNVQVQAHGIVTNIVVKGGQSFKSPLIGEGGDTGPFYVVSDNSPTNDPSSDDVLCGRVASKASSTPKIEAGSTLSYNWLAGYSNEDGFWPHDVGPMYFYMAKCSTKDCAKETTPGGGDFFKVQQYGFSSGSTWKQAELHEGKPVEFTIPSSLAPGTYIIRHEVINLALTHEMFPSCQRFEITGSGTTELSGESAKFPGAYSVTDKGLAVGGAPVYAIKSNSGYTFPGPAVIGIGSGVTGAKEDDSSSADESSTTASGTTSDDATPTEVPVAVGNVAGGSDVTTTTDSSADTVPAANNSSLGDCAQQWTDCNAKYMEAQAASVNSATTKRAAYTCQTDYTSCVAATMKTAKRMHRVRRSSSFFDSH
ncbi:glycosyl hydrolase family 61-domain-containing protein [Flagelloscypha sp. PMI_526]|nr:glycosyl hydrolase family 61-domain-containing protein [Flagelloscypha sp. PMI_526]